MSIPSVFLNGLNVVKVFYGFRVFGVGIIIMPFSNKIPRNNFVKKIK